MGSHDVQAGGSDRQRRQFVCAVLEDLEVLGELIASGRLESAWRIGAEQEFVVVDSTLAPSPMGPEIVARTGEARFTTELGRFNLEANLTPRALRNGCLSGLRTELEALTRYAQSHAAAFDAQLVMAGILPSFELAHATRHWMTPSPRYEELDRIAMASQGGKMSVALHGTDTLITQQDSIMLEALGTSFQVHLQVPPAHFNATYNWAVATAAPLVAAAAFSPLLAGKRLWHETRIALMEICADVRGPGRLRRGSRPRTSLGPGWISESVLELYRADLAAFEAVLCPQEVESSRERLRAGELPDLKALTMFNGSVWPWMRACYGVSGGRPHLRIENRILPSGPTVLDELANAALWVGLMVSLPFHEGSPSGRMAFGDAEANFQAAARGGLGASLTWLDGRRVNGRDLLLRELIPMARAGLRAFGVSSEEVALLDVVADRVRSGRTGAAWMLETFEHSAPELTPRKRAQRVTARLVEEAATGMPVHQWSTEPAGVEENLETPVSAHLREDTPILRTDEAIALAARVAQWQQTEYVPLEAADGRFGGVVTRAALEAAVSRGEGARAVDEVTRCDLPRLSLRATIGDALEALAAIDEGAALVLEEDKLVGLVFEEDLAHAAGVPSLRRRRVAEVGVGEAVTDGSATDVG